MSYRELLKSEKWKRFRIIAIYYYGNKCSICGTTHHLHVHHIEYKENLLPWEYPLEYIQILCSSCHRKVHGGRIIRKLRNMNTIQSLMIKSFKDLQKK